MKKSSIQKTLVLFSVMAALVFFSVPASASGGPGAKKCSGGVKILGVGWEHSVECEEGYYAKCGIFRARCIENPQ